MARRWPWDRPKAEPSPELAQALARLDRLGRERPELEGPARGLADVLAAAFGVPVGPEWDRLRPEAIAAAWAEGRPAAQGSAPEPSFDELRKRFAAIARTLASANPAAGTLAEVPVEAWCLDTWAGRTTRLVEDSQQRGIDPALTVSAWRLTLLPGLARWTRAIETALPASRWSSDLCLHCGRLSVLTESRGLEQARFLRCGWCAASWAGPRLGCPACGETDHRKLRNRHVEGEEARYRLSLCETCGHARKIVATLGPCDPPGLVVVELATVHLDLILASEDRDPRTPSG